MKHRLENRSSPGTARQLHSEPAASAQAEASSELADSQQLHEVLSRIDGRLQRLDALMKTES